MRIRTILGLLAVVVCMVSVMTFSFGSQEPINTTDATGPERTSNADQAAVSFQDVLNTPAMKTDLAPKSPVCAIACAGKRIVGVGGRGIIVYSDDAGKSWTQASVPVSCDLTAICFASPQKGWVVGHDGVVLNTTDAGTTWAKQLDGNEACRIMNEYYVDHPVCGQTDSEAAEKLRGDIKFIVGQGPVNPFLDVWFDNESSGFVVGAFNLIFRTRDGGKTWEPWFDRTENPSGLHFYSIRPSGGHLFLSGEQGMMWKLDQAAGRFQAIQTPYNGTLFGIIGKPGLILTFGQRGNLYRSQDEGTSWQKVETGVAATIFGGTATEDGRIILVTQAGNILESKDKGISFTELESSIAGVPQYAVVALNKEKIATAGMIGLHVQSIQ